MSTASLTEELAALQAQQLGAWNARRAEKAAFETAYRNKVAAAPIAERQAVMNATNVEREKLRWKHLQAEKAASAAYRKLNDRVKAAEQAEAELLPTHRPTGERMTPEEAAWEYVQSQYLLGLEVQIANATGPAKPLLVQASESAKVHIGWNRERLHDRLAMEKAGITDPKVWEERKVTASMAVLHAEAMKKEEADLAARNAEFVAEMQRRADAREAARVKNAEAWSNPFGQTGVFTNLVEAVPFGGLVTATVAGIAGNPEHAKIASLKGAVSGVSAVLTIGAGSINPALGVLVAGATSAGEDLILQAYRPSLPPDLMEKVAEKSTRDIVQGAVISSAMAGLPLAFGKFSKSGGGVIKDAAKDGVASAVTNTATKSAETSALSELAASAKDAIKPLVGMGKEVKAGFDSAIKSIVTPVGAAVGGVLGETGKFWAEKVTEKVVKGGLGEIVQGNPWDVGPPVLPAPPGSSTPVPAPTAFPVLSAAVPAVTTRPTTPPIPATPPPAIVSRPAGPVVPDKTSKPWPVIVGGVVVVGAIVGGGIKMLNKPDSQPAATEQAVAQAPKGPTAPVAPVLPAAQTPAAPVAPINPVSPVASSSSAAHIPTAPSVAPVAPVAPRPAGAVQPVSSQATAASTKPAPTAASPVSSTPVANGPTIRVADWTLLLKTGAPDGENNKPISVAFQVDNGTVSGSGYDPSLERTLVTSGTIDSKKVATVTIDAGDHGTIYLTGLIQGTTSIAGTYQLYIDETDGTTTTYDGSFTMQRG